MRKTLLLVLALITNAFLFGQETLKDIVPVLKGTKLGLQYHSGKPFHPAVFDFIQWNDEGETPTLYFTDENDNIYFKVIKQEKLYRFDGKKLVFLEDIPRFTPPRILRDEEIEDETTSGGSDSYALPGNSVKGIVLIDSLRLGYEDTATVKVWYDADTRLFRFQYKGEWIKDFDCDKIIKKHGGPAYYTLATLSKGSKQTIADFHTRKLVLPFEYDSVKRVFAEAYIVEKDGKQGVVNSLNNFIVPPSYKSISASDQADGYCFLYGQNETGFNIIGVELYQPTSQTTKIIAGNYDVMPRAFVAHTATEPHVYFIVNKKNKLGLIDYNGKEILPIEYDNISEPDFSPYGDDVPRFVSLMKNKLNGWLDIGTQTLVKPVYSYVGVKLQLEKQVKELPVYIFLVRQKGTAFFVDNLGKEFRSR